MQVLFVGDDQANLESFADLLAAELCSCYPTGLTPA